MKSEEYLRSKKKIITITSLIVILILGLCTNSIMADEMDKYDLVYKIGDEPVYKGEFSLFNKGGQSKDDILKETIEIKSKQILTKEYGIREDITYKTFIKNLDEENERRAKAKLNNEVIYGPEKYSEYQYYTYLLERDMTELELKIENDESIVNNKAIDDYYYENKEIFKIENGAKVNIMSISFVGEDGSVDSNNKKLALQNINKLRDELLRGNSVEQDEVRNWEYDFKYENRSLDANTIEELKVEAINLKNGEISNIIEFNGEYHVLVCKETYEQGYEDISIVKDQIRVSLVKKELDKLIIEKINDVEVKMNNKVYDSI